MVCPAPTLLGSMILPSNEPITLKMICRKHIEHTKKQQDNERCPMSKERKMRLMNVGCLKTLCRRREKTHWAFENDQEGQVRWVFCRK
ncbi:hypothetical protein LZ554_005612 [Drepanopeziza brunnea f. sp. 'monogermtubi']|nr:hypothetical protein LZ554_005612 [Drepanopeziza brunnea f. sp. 'monogermtubi']